MCLVPSTREIKIDQVSSLGRKLGNRDFPSVVFQSRVITAALKVLGFADQSGMPTKHQLPDFELLKKSEKLDCMHKLAAKVVDEFVFQNSSVVNDIVDSGLTRQKKDDLLQQQEHLKEEFQAGFQVVTNHLSRRSHELSHEPPVQLEEEPPTLTTSRPCFTPNRNQEKR